VEFCLLWVAAVLQKISSGVVYKGLAVSILHDTCELDRARGFLDHKLLVAAHLCKASPYSHGPKLEGGILVRLAFP